MKFKSFFIQISFFFCFLLHAQTADREVLLEVGGDPVYVSDFLKVYNKNLDLVQDESQKNVDAYLELFINYKLKLKEAKTLGFDEKPAYKRELQSYRSQLAKNFMADNTVTEALMEEAYHRISNEVKAQHLLVRIDETASPKDTLVAFNKIKALKEKALREGFEKVMKNDVDGKNILGEYLGWFGGFKMVYAFENAAYNTPVGGVSDPFRTRFGYHVLNVIDKRESRGERTIAHIMIMENEEGSSNEDPEVRIQDIYKKINQGEDFESLAKQFSDDKSSASKGGVMPPISSGQISALEFEDVVFGLQEVGDVSKPFETQYGWHIVKLYEKIPVASYDALKAELAVKVKRDERSKLIDDALYNKIKGIYKVSDTPPNLDYFVSILNKDYYSRKWAFPEDFQSEKILFEINGKPFTYNDFGSYLIKTQHTVRSTTGFKTIVETKFQDFFNASLIAYHEGNLENYDPEFANIVTEYRDGLLLFDLMENTIWNASKTDSLDIQNFYDTHKNNYVLPERIDAVVASSSKQKTLKKVSKLLSKGMALEQIKNLVNSNDAVDVIFTTGIMDANHQALPKDFKFKKGISKIFKHNNAFEIVEVKTVLPETQKTLEESQGAVVSDYQNDKEEKWVATLASKYKVEINNEALEKVKSQIEKQ
ncbi:peptidylprolyl isomerase [Algibacter miyuki]|uniref:Peptidylprolyl isomerase n=1 Tax=Algibacter miyuki TaxID=1306933 RepID=A0ABV5H400_9FLAO|nr:peptidylprolyl isomerase [Algibacter miyuki]MDN3665518.1 peptidylprolyl isomerase [Algibacter miyuki]